MRIILKSTKRNSNKNKTTTTPKEKERNETKQYNTNKVKWKEETYRLTWNTQTIFSDFETVHWRAFFVCVCVFLLWFFHECTWICVLYVHLIHRTIPFAWVYVCDENIPVICEWKRQRWGVTAGRQSKRMGYRIKRKDYHGITEPKRNHQTIATITSCYTFYHCGPKINGNL